MKKLAVAIALLVLVAYFALWPVPTEPIAWDAPKDEGLVGAFSPNDSLAALEQVPFGGHAGPEDISQGFDGRLFATSHDGKIISFDRALGDVRVFAETGGRPLGIEFAGDHLYIANAYLGVQRVYRDARVETIVDEYQGAKLEYVDDLAVSADGRIFFSDASSKFGAEAWGGTYEASLLDIVEHGGHGRIFVHDPTLGTTSLLMSGLEFANGVALAKDERFLLVAETGTYRIWRYWLEGERQGEQEVIIDNLPGFPDNINNGEDGRFWVGLVAPRVPLLDRFSDSPGMRRFTQRLPAFLRPKAIPTSHLIAIAVDGGVVANLQDPAVGFPSITGAVEVDGYLYPSSLFATDIARIAVSRDLVHR